MASGGTTARSISGGACCGQLTVAEGFQPFMSEFIGLDFDVASGNLARSPEPAKRLA
jgi:hypothetical protein